MEFQTATWALNEGNERAACFIVPRSAAAARDWAAKIMVHGEYAALGKDDLRGLLLAVEAAYLTQDSVTLRPGPWTC